MFSLDRMDVKKRLAIVLAVAVSCLVALSVFALLNLRAAEMAGHRERIKNLVESAHGVVANYVQLAADGKLTPTLAQLQAKTALRALRFGHNDYFFIYDFDGRAVMVAGNPKIEGKVMLGKTDVHGFPLWDEIVRIGKGPGSDFIEYWFPRAGSDVASQKLGYVSGIPEWKWVIGTGVYVDDVNEILLQQAIRYGIGVLLAILIAGGIGLVASRSIVRQLGGEPALLMSIMQRAADGNLSTDFSVKGGSSSVLANLKAMLEGLGALAREVRQASMDLEKSAHSVSQTTSKVLKMAGEQADGTSAMAAAMEQMTVAVNHIADNARDTEADSRVSAEHAGKGEQQALVAVGKIQDLVHTAQQTSQSVGGLVKRAEEIGSITAVIKEIAAQTNLLALNAAIEAARAGEQGRGFAVVADEVRGLAERTARATVEIEKMIQTIQSETQASVLLLTESVPQANQGVALSEATASVLRDIRAGMQLTLERVQDVAGSTREQSLASNNIAQQVERIAGVVEETRSVMELSAQEVAQLEQLSQTLQQSVSRFHL
jgi:methyl-accepting chemotaxis protein